MKVTLLDTKSGETREVAGICGFQWADNNWSCDCNRAGYFGPPDDWNDGDGVCVGGHRFIVITSKAEDSGEDHYTLADLNPGYPEELLAEHGILPLTGDGNLVHFVPQSTDATDPAALADKFVENLQKQDTAPPEPQATGVEVITLHEMYNPALLGFAANPAMPVAVYSIELMLATVQTAEAVGREMATHHVQMVIEACTKDLGPRAPVFVDDFEFVQRQKQGGPKIVTPGT